MTLIFFVRYSASAINKTPSFNDLPLFLGRNREFFVTWFQGLFGNFGCFTKVFLVRKFETIGGVMKLGRKKKGVFGQMPTPQTMIAEIFFLPKRK